MNAISTLHYVKKLMGTRLLIKLGGSMLQSPELPLWLTEDIGLLRSIGVSVFLVHGGGPLINEELKRRNIPYEFVDGQRVTTPEIMEVIESVLFGAVNRKLVRALNLRGIPAVGISGIEAATLFCKPMPQLGRVGDVSQVDASLIEAILSTKTRDGKGAIPVIAPIGTDGGKTFNINADWAASRLAQSLSIKKMIFLTDQDGILDTSGKVITDLDASEVANLVEQGTVRDGMMTKSRSILEALRNGVSAIHVLNGKRDHALVEELFTERGVGTICRVRARSTGEL